MTTVTPVVEAYRGGRPMLVLRPDPSPGPCSVDVLCTLARARARAADACFLPPMGEAAALVTGVTGGDVPIVTAAGWQAAWFGARWRLAASARRRRERWRERVASGLHEGYRELRRHAGDERLPVELRRRLREAAHRCYDRSVSFRSRVTPYPRRLLREPSSLSWDRPQLERARAEADASGVPQGVPLVAFEAGRRPDIAADVIRFLVGEGCTVVRIGRPGAGPLRQPGLIDLSARPERSMRLELFVLQAAAFAVCASIDLQQLTYLTNTPALTVDAADPFTAYPIRANGLVLLGPMVDLDSGRVLTTDERLSERVLRNPRHWGLRASSAADTIEAIRELRDGLARGFRDSDAQQAFRARVADAGRALRPAVPLVAEWGPDDGFVGDGRLARVQAERVS